MNIKFIIIVIFVGLINGCSTNDADFVYAGNYDKNIPINSFQYTGNWIACISDAADDLLACHHIGKIKIGDAYNPSGKPFQEAELSEGVTASAFAIIKNDTQEAYWVIGHKENKIVSVQLTGNFPHPDLSFSSIMLGDNMKKVERILGPKHSILKFDDTGISGILWDYAPFEFSFEFVDEKVYSIRVTR